MPDTSQQNPTSSDDSTADAVPNLGNLEYSTPSAYVDPSLNSSSPSEPAPVSTEPTEASATEPTEAPTDVSTEPTDESNEAPDASEPSPVESLPEPTFSASSVPSEVIDSIKNAKSILIALSSSPSVDELASAIALSLLLGRMEKHAIAIYTGTTPNALEFLKPEDTLKTSPDVLQDFVIAIDKEKADHIRYTLEGDYVKIFITPYRGRIAAEDLEYSYGDFNVDLVLALNVHDANDLDSALREHGRIIHDAPTISISTSISSSISENKWNDPTMSSISEMIASLFLALSNEPKIDSEEATALLTGIVAATNHFSSASTSPTTMKIASILIEDGADPQLISANIKEAPSESASSESSSSKSSPSEPPASSPAESKPTTSEVEPSEEKSSESVSNEPASANEPAPTEPESSKSVSSEPSTPSVESEPAAEPTPSASELSHTTELSIPAPAIDTTSKYGQMLDEALSEPSAGAPAPMESSLPPVNPAASSTPTIEATPEVGNIPDINFGQTASDQVLPPPPAPPIDINSPMPLPTPPDSPLSPSTPPTPPASPSTPPTPPASEASATPAAPASPPTPPAPDAFTIPGI